MRKTENKEVIHTGEYRDWLKSPKRGYNRVR